MLLNIQQSIATIQNNQATMQQSLNAILQNQNKSLVSSTDVREEKTALNRPAAASSHGEEMRGGKSKKREAGTSGVLDDEQRKLKLVKKARHTGDLSLKIPQELRGLY
jgi:hypothetical protein